MGTKANVLIGTVEVTVGVGIEAQVIGYTVDGVVMTVRSEFADLKVEDIEGTIIRALTHQEIEVTLNMAEGELQNMANAIPGSKLNGPGTILTLGGGELQEHRLTLLGKTTTGYDRLIVLDAVNPTGEVGMPFKKGEITVIPVAFKALVSDSGVFGTKTDGLAADPLLVVGADTKSTADGTKIEAKFNTNMADPTGKHMEFWFSEESIGNRAFSAVGLKSGSPDTFELTVSGAAITSGKTLTLSYAMGSVLSSAHGILKTFNSQAVVARP